MDMEKIKKGDELSMSTDLVQENIAKLKELFPNIVAEGKIDFTVLKDILGEEIEEGEEYYRFTWAGKTQARREAHKPSTGTLRPAKEESVDWDNTQNLYIEGDNLEVLKLLQKTYAGKIKMIYIDPPYNTGKDFVYKDNYKDNLKNYQELTGQIDEEGTKLTTNTESQGRYHSNWLNMIYPRLILARNLLKDDGVIFISIDDNEASSLKKVCDEIFGEDNFAANIVWQKKYAVSADDPGIAAMHDHIVCYRKTDNFKRILLPRTEKQLQRYKNTDNDPRGPWSSDNYVSNKSKEERPTLWYPIKHPKTGSDVWPDESAVWRYSVENHEKMVLENRLYWGPNESYEKPRLKRFLSEIQSGIVPSTWWAFDEVGHNDEGQKETATLIGKKIFSTPKPIRLLERILAISVDKKDIILDFFSGSAATAHAVMQLNAEDGGNRRHIQVQLPEPTDEKSEAHKAGYKTIAEIGKERIRRAAKKIAEENPDKAGDLDLGFKVFKLDTSNIKAWDGNLDNLKENLFDAVSNIKAERSEEDVLYEILLKYGLDLSLPIEEKLMEGKKVFNVGKGALFICLADNITAKVAEGIGKWKDKVEPEICRVVFKDGGFNDVEKANAVQTLKRHGIAEIKSI